MCFVSMDIYFGSRVVLFEVFIFECMLLSPSFLQRDVQSIIRGKFSLVHPDKIDRFSVSRFMCRFAMCITTNMYLFLQIVLHLLIFS